MDIALGIAVPLPLLPDPTHPTASYHKKPRTEQSRAAKPMQSEPVREKCSHYRNGKQPCWD